MRKSIILLSGLLLFVATDMVQAQTFEEWKKQQQEEFQQFKDERDKAFLEMLKEAWDYIDSDLAPPTYTEPKVDEAPKADKDNQPEETKTITVDTSEAEEQNKRQKREDQMPDKSTDNEKTDKAPEPKPDLEKPEPETIQTPPKDKEEVKERKPSPIEKIKEKRDKERKTNKPVPNPDLKTQPVPNPVKEKTPEMPKGEAIMFVNQSVQLPLRSIFSDAPIKEINPEGISAWWETMSKREYEPALVMLQAQKEALGLNDWGLAHLTNEYAKKTYPAHEPSQNALTWFLLSKLGFEARVGYNDNLLYLLMPANNRLFGITYYTFDGEKYYIIDFDKPTSINAQLYTYQGEYPGTPLKMDLYVDRYPNFEADEDQREISFAYKGKEYKVVAKFDRSYSDFAMYYPQTELPVYFTAPASELLRSSVIRQLEKHLEEIPQDEHLNFLLRFIQLGFDYKTDHDQFGYEKFFFVDEIFYYPYSDCEDRSVLFAWLVKELLGKQVVGLKYPGHLATAVEIDRPLKGDQFSYKDKRFIVCDPTYVNANAGMTMSRFSNTQPKIVEF
jgi:outer membrane biosynthesis protein TonB